MDKNIFLKNSSGETLNPATSSLKVTAFSASSLNNYTDLVVYLPHGLIEFNVYGKSRQDNVYSITIGLPDDTRKKLYAMFGEILRTGTGVAKNNGNSEFYMFTYDLAIGSTAGSLLIKLNKPIDILTTSTITFTTNLNKFVTPSALGVLDGTDTNDTQPVHIDASGKLWTAPGGGTEITIDPNGGLQNTPKGLSIKGDSTAQGGPGIATGSTGAYTPISSDGKRGSIIGVSKTDQQTEVVGIGSDGKLYTKPIGGTGDIEIDPAGGLEKGSAGYGLMLGANSGLNVDEDGLKIKPDTTGLFSSGLTIGNNGIKVTTAKNNILGGIVGTTSNVNQTEAVGIDSQGRLYTKTIPGLPDNLSNFNFYVDAVNGSDSNTGTKISTAFKTIEKAFSSFPDFSNTCRVSIIGEYGTLGESATFKKHCNRLEIVGPNQNKTDKLLTNLIVYNAPIVYLSGLTLKANKIVQVAVPDWGVDIQRCDIDQTFDPSTARSSNICVVFTATGYRLNTGSISITGATACNAFVLYHGSTSLVTIPQFGSAGSSGGFSKPININGYNQGLYNEGFFIIDSKKINIPNSEIRLSLLNVIDVANSQPVAFSSELTIDSSMLTDVYQKTISGYTINNVVNDAKLILYGTTAKQLYFNWDGEVLGTGAIMKGNFTGFGTISYNSYIYSCVVRINTNGNVELYAPFDSNVTIPSGTTVTILANNINPGARL